MPKPTESELRTARVDAEQAEQLAHRWEDVAGRARREARSKRKHYEDMLLVYQGQLELALSPEEGP